MAYSWLVDWSLFADSAHFGDTFDDALVGVWLPSFGWLHAWVFVLVGALESDHSGDWYDVNCLQSRRWLYGWVFLLVGGVSFVSGSIRWCVWSFRPSSPFAVAAPYIFVCLFVCLGSTFMGSYVLSWVWLSFSHWRSQLASLAVIGQTQSLPRHL